MYLDYLGVSFRYEDMRINWLEEITKGYCVKCGATRPRILRSYTPDFVLPNGIILECKGKFVAEERKKHAAIKEQHPELDIRLLFQYDSKITKNSKTRYTEWCRKKEIPAAVGHKLPDHWREECFAIET
jgi:hypothetical protein